MALGTAIVATLALAGAGVPPTHAVLAVVACVTTIGGLVLLRTSVVWSRARSIWVGASALCPDRARSREQRYLEDLAEKMSAAAEARRAEHISAQEYAQIWEAVYSEVGRLERQQYQSTAPTA